VSSIKEAAGPGALDDQKKDEAAQSVSPCFEFVRTRDRHVVQSLVARRTCDAATGAGKRVYGPVKDEVKDAY
jgi:hypothetical protein